MPLYLSAGMATYVKTAWGKEPVIVSSVVIAIVGECTLMFPEIQICFILKPQKTTELLGFLFQFSSKKFKKLKLG